MAKHSHWDNIKHKKAANDAKRGAVIAKMGKLITVAVQVGGPVLDENPRLRLAVTKARSAGMSQEVIERAIRKASGEGKSGAVMTELLYEGYAPGGIAMVVQILTDNRNRTAPEIKKLFERAGGSIGNPGCVAWQFKPKAVFLVGAEDGPAVAEDTVIEALLSAGCDVDDVAASGGQVAVTADPRQFDAIAKALAGARLPASRADFTQIPDNTVPAAGAAAAALRTLVDSLDDHDDVTEVFHNAELVD
jgi:YebC/PmpR family DNA-binding regulatory protein